MAYLTANEDDFSVDYINLLSMIRFHPGVERVHLFIAVSEVRPKGVRDNSAWSLIKTMLGKCGWIELEEVIYKTNIGRDFSSAHACLQAISEMASDDDQILFRNRSAYGPFKENWYCSYRDLFESDSKVGLVGNTINQSGHSQSEYQGSNDLAHIQTYIYLSSYSILKSLLSDFPGERETDRLALINNGEIGLSQRLISDGFYITCLNWPRAFFGMGVKVPKELPKGDIKKDVLDLPFIHRRSGISYPSFWQKLKWFCLRVPMFFVGIRQSQSL